MTSFLLSGILSIIFFMKIYKRCTIEEYFFIDRKDLIFYYLKNLEVSKMDNLSKTSESEFNNGESNVSEDVSVTNNISFSFHSVLEDSEEIVKFLAKYPKKENDVNGFVAGERGKLAKRIGSKISDYMAINNYGEKEFAKLCGISRTTLRKILSAEIHKFESNINTYQKIATKGLGIKLIELLKKGEF